MGRIGREERIRLYWSWERRIGLMDRLIINIEVR
jgi:hypothetical protein